MAKLKRDINGFEAVKRLKKHGWDVSSRKGSHVSLKKKGETNILTIICKTKPMKTGTLRSILRKAGISPANF